MKTRRVRTPTVLQLEAAECGAASLGAVLGFYGRHVRLEQLRVECGVSRDGANAKNILAAAKKHGLEGQGLRAEVGDLERLELPLIAHWSFNHFVVVEGIGDRGVYLNDPATGPRLVPFEEVDRCFTGVVLSLRPGPAFVAEGECWTPVRSFLGRVAGSKSALALQVFAGLALAVPSLAAPAFARIFVDEVLAKSGRTWLPWLFLAMALAVAVQATLEHVRRRGLLALENKLAISGSGRLFWHVLRLPIRFHLQRSAGELADRMLIENRVARLLSGRLASALLGGLLISFYLALMLQYDVVLALVGLGAVALQLAALRAAARVRADAHRRLALERGRLAGVSVNGLEMIETIKATAAEPEWLAIWAGHHARLLRAQQKAQSASQWMSALPALLNAVSFAAVLAAGGLRVMDAEMTLGMLIAFQALMVGLLGPVNELIALGNELFDIEGDAKRLDDVLAHPLDRTLAQPAVSEVTELEGAIELEDVTFGYSELEAPLVEELSLSVKPGTRVALVGRSGSGKSTIAKLVAGLHRPWAGTIRVDGRARDEHPRTLLAGAIGFVDQDVLLFEGTALDNLTMWDTTVSEARAMRAAKDACIHDELVARRGGYASTIEEGGRDLSGGQRQRIEIARALIHDPAILVLDEATSALDPLTEKTLGENLRRRGCTCLIVAHRLSTIRDADEIIVLERGRIVERGTHEQLRGLGGAYTRLIESEAA